MILWIKVDSEVDSVSNSSSDWRKEIHKPTRFPKLKPIVHESVPSDIGFCVYQVPIRSNLASCKGGHPWGNTVTSNTQHFKGMH